LEKLMPRSDDKNSPTTRREFFRAAARYAALGGLALLSGKLASQATGTREAPCSGDGLCGRCPALANCPLPQALATRSAPQKPQMKEPR
jgi:hypothetical protein